VSSPNAEAGRGRRADRPSEVPRKGWRDILFRVKDQISEDNLGHIAAGVAFYWLLAMFPAMGALISTYGLAADPVDLETQLIQLAGVLPDYVRDLLAEQLKAIVTANPDALSFGVIFGFLFTLWSATKGVSALIVALNIAYDEHEKRGFFRLTLTALALTLGVVLFAAVTLGLVVALPAAIKWLPLGRFAEIATLALRWPLLGAAMVLGLSTLYHFGPSRRRPRWRWVTWGAAGVTAVWLIASMGFSYYVTHFGDYNKTYGSVGGVMFLLMWFWISAYLVLIGAEVNAELEHQTARDTTIGPRKARGRRGAYVADTVGAAKP
jgi:membrane protein